MILNWGLCFVFALKLSLDRQLRSIPLIRLPKACLFFQWISPHAACTQEEEHRTTKTEEGQKGKSTTWTMEQQLAALHMEPLDENMF